MHAFLDLAEGALPQGLGHSVRPNDRVVLVSEHLFVEWQVGQQVGACHHFDRVNDFRRWSCLRNAHTWLKLVYWVLGSLYTAQWPYLQV